MAPLCGLELVCPKELDYISTQNDSELTSREKWKLDKEILKV